MSRSCFLAKSPFMCYTTLECNYGSYFNFKNQGMLICKDARLDYFQMYLNMNEALDGQVFHSLLAMLQLSLKWVLLQLFLGLDFYAVPVVDTQDTF